MADWDKMLERIMLGKRIKALAESIPSSKRLLVRFIALRDEKERRHMILDKLLNVARRKKQGQL